MGKNRHQPVLLEEAVEALQIKPDGVYLDGTFGRGGHSRAVMARLTEQGRLFSLDRDPEALAAGMELAEQDPRFHIDQGNYAEMERYVLAWGLEDGLDGICWTWAFLLPSWTIRSGGSRLWRTARWICE